MENTANQMTLIGTLRSMPEYSHTNHDRRFFRLMLAAPRLSGAVDVLPVLAAEDVLAPVELRPGMRLLAEGQIRSFNNRQPEGRRLILCVYAARLEPTQEEPVNRAELTGTLCKEPVFRRTPLGREIADLMLAVPRLYRRMDYIPCIVWGRTAELCAPLPAGTALSLTGRMQSREYIKILDGQSVTRTAYELSVSTCALQE